MEGREDLGRDGEEMVDRIHCMQKFIFNLKKKSAHFPQKISTLKLSHLLEWQGTEIYGKKTTQRGFSALD